MRSLPDTSTQDQHWELNIDLQILSLTPYPLDHVDKLCFLLQGAGQKRQMTKAGLWLICELTYQVPITAFGQRQCGMWSLPNTSTHDQHWELNTDLWILSQMPYPLGYVDKLCFLLQGAGQKRQMTKAGLWFICACKLSSVKSSFTNCYFSTVVYWMSLRKNVKLHCHCYFAVYYFWKINKWKSNHF